LEKILGIDESGKGDFFGPLVIAGVLAGSSEEKRLIDAGVRDSKKIADNKVLQLAGWIKENFVHSVVTIGPEKYNELYKKIANLNRLLAWGHSRVIENIVAENQVDLAISDKFGHSSYIERALMAKGKEIVLKQEVRAEAIAQVAAASILARAGYLMAMSKLSGQYGVTIPKGAGAPVDQAAQVLMGKFGPDVFSKIAKMHFKNYKKIIQ
jgi:ribonuclease HIII